MEKRMIVRVFDNEFGRGYVCNCSIDDKFTVEGKGETMAEAVGAVRKQLSEDVELKALYFGSANTRSVLLTDKGGITSTSANYLANVAQEIMQEKKVTLENISFLNSKILTPTCPEGLEYGKANFDLATISDTINEIGNINAFCAWMREGISAKEEALNAVNEITFDKWMKVHGIKETDMPVRRTFTKADAEDKLSVGERLQMLRSEAIAAAFGKFIHKDMPVSEARKALQYRILNPVEKDGTGKDLTLIKYEAAITTAEVDAVFMQLQNKQREAEKTLNHYKADVLHACAEMNIESEKFFSEWVEQRKANRDQLVSRYNADMTMVREEINKLKITLPEALKTTYGYLNSLGK